MFISLFFSLVQTLLPSSPVDFTVEKITASHEGSFLALSGKRGVTVLELPRRWGPNGQYKEGKERILCRYVVRVIHLCTFIIGKFHFYFCTQNVRMCFIVSDGIA